MTDKLSSGEFPSHWTAEVAPAKAKRPFNEDVGTDELKEGKGIQKDVVREAEGRSKDKMGYRYIDGKRISNAAYEEYIREKREEEVEIARIKRENPQSELLQRLGQDFSKVKEGPAEEKPIEDETPVEPVQQEETTKQEDYKKSVLRRIEDASREKTV